MKAVFKLTAVKNGEVVTAPKTYAGDIKAIAKAVETFLIFSLQLHSNIVSLNKRFGIRVFQTAQVLAAIRYRAF